MLINK